MPKNQDDAARKIQLFWRRHHAKEEAQLPGSFDDCMAFFTGYRKTPIVISSPQEMLELALKCAKYCAKLGDKDSLELLIYAVLRRCYQRDETFHRDKQDAKIVRTLDAVRGDYAGIYKNKPKQQLNDTFLLFKAFIQYSTTQLPVDLNFSVLERQLPVNTQDLVKWHEKFKQAITKSKPELLVKAQYALSRGGGLYQFLDTLKGLALPIYDDSRSALGLYFTPEHLDKRDKFYAHRLSGARAFFDIPCQITGFIDKDKLFSTNCNAYEAFVRYEDICAIDGLTLQPYPVDYSSTTLQHLSIALPGEFLDDDSGLNDRLGEINHFLSHGP